MVWNSEAKRIKKQHGKDISWVYVIMLNKVSLYFFVYAAMLALIYFFLGISSVVYQFAYAAFGLFFLGTVNYIEHYGAQRQKDENGVYESIGKTIAFNSFSTPGLWRIQKHSDHHVHTFRPMQILRH